MPKHIIEPIDAPLESVAAAMVKKGAPIKGGAAEPAESEKAIVFSNEGSDIRLRFDPGDQAMWATAQNIADLFGVDVSVAVAAGRHADDRSGPQGRGELDLNRC